MKVAIITPVTELTKTMGFYKRLLANYTEITPLFLGLEQGVGGISTEFDVTVTAAEVLRQAYNAWQQGVDAVIVNCLTEPALLACRELLSIPVFGILESCLLSLKQSATILCPKFHENYPQLILRRAKAYTNQPISLQEINLANDVGSELQQISEGKVNATIIVSSGYLLQFQPQIEVAFSQACVIPLEATIQLALEVFSEGRQHEFSNPEPLKEKVASWLSRSMQ